LEIKLGLTVDEKVESSIRQRCEAGDYPAAATGALEAYGVEIRRFLAARMRNAPDAHEVFSMFCEDLWSGLPGFAWRCTLRGWAFTLARHAELRFRASPGQRKGFEVTLPESVASEMRRSTTAPHQRTEVKSRFREIRSRLGQEDQLLLILRVDRSLGWRDIAHVLAADANPSSAELKREEARIRKRFQLIKERLRGWAEASGLLPPSPTDRPQ
jgi:RNA polymerase sigma-70 factor (ECF subfamily)